MTPTEDLGEVDARLAMPLAEAMRTQRAVRRVLADPFDDNILVRCLELALEAPSGSNSQNWEFIIVKDRAIKAALALQYRLAWGTHGSAHPEIGSDDQTERIRKSVEWQVDHFEEIPVLVVCCLRTRYRVPLAMLPQVVVSSYYGSIYPCVQNLLLAARAVGLGGALITLPLWSENVARGLLALPPTVNPCCIVSLGWPRGRYGNKGRKAIGTVMHLDQYGRQPWR
jgi:nitroreductase